MRTLVARRTARKFSTRTTAFVELRKPESRRIAPLLARAPDVERLYVCGPRPAPRDGLAAWCAELPEGWHADPNGHYLEGEHPVVRLVRPDGTRVEVLRAAAWFGEGDYTAAACTGAWELLGAEVAHRFGEGAAPLSSPAATGRDLFLRSIPRGREWEPMSDDYQQLVRATTGQGRIELFPRTGELPELVGYDGRMMYAALCRELPGGAGRHERVREYLGYTRARYNATAHVPRDWHTSCSCGAPGHAGLGLLGHWTPDGWEYPSEPGRSFTGWWDGAEVQVALAHGWTFTYTTALVFDRVRGVGPLDGWASRIIGARNRLVELHGQVDTDEGRDACRLAGVAVRAIALHAIGAFFAGRRKVTRSCPVDQAEQLVPADAEGLRTEGEVLVWNEYVEAAWPALCHPEWSAAVWARARARLLSAPDGLGGRVGALHVPTSTLVAFRTDALYLSADPEWGDDGRPGRFRRQTRVAGPVPAPTNAAELVEMTR